MPRRGNVPKRDVLPDPMYNSKVVTKLINQIMLDGKKGTAQTIVYDAFKLIEEKVAPFWLPVKARIQPYWQKAKGMITRKK